MKDPRPGGRRASEYLDIVRISVSTSVLVGFGAAVARIAENRYVPLGFFRNALLTLRHAILQALLAGLLFALACLLLRALARAVIRRFPRAGAFPGEGTTYASGVVLPLLAAGSGAMLILAVYAFRRDSVSNSLVLFVAGAAFLWGFLFAASRRLPAAFAVHRLLLLAAIPALTACIVFASHRSDYAILSRPAVLIVVTVWAGFLAWEASTRQASSGLRSAGLRLTAGLPLAAAALGVAASFLPAGQLRAARPENVVLIGIDTLRWDHVSLDPVPPGGRDLTPSLRSLARRGTIFRNAISQAPWTKPAFGSILTGLYPRQHGAVSYWGALRPADATLPEILREAGYRTGAVVSHWYVDSRAGFAQGVDSFQEDNARGHWAITSRSVTEESLRFLRGVGGRPFFLFVHYFDPHFEYRHHPGWSFARDYRGWLTRDRLSIDNLLKNRHRLSPADVGYLKDLYDEEIAFTDSQLGRLLRELKDRGLDAKTAVVVVGDHGEEFMEHGGLSHTTTLYEEAIHVPLVVALPGTPGARKAVDEVVETRGIFAMLLEYLGVRWNPPPEFSGLLARIDPARAARAAARAAVAYSEVWLPDAPLESGTRVQLSCLRGQDWKIIRDHRSGSESLFDLRGDPGERDDRAQADPNALSRMRDALDALLSGMPGQTGRVPRQELNDEMLRELKALGYL
jgi:arylsulfatase A-like enzyme